MPTPYHQCELEGFSGRANNDSAAAHLAQGTRRIQKRVYVLGEAVPGVAPTPASGSEAKARPVERPAPGKSLKDVLEIGVGIVAADFG